MHLVCKICGHESKRSLIQHLFRKHNYSAEQYRLEFGHDLILILGKSAPPIKIKYKSTSIWQPLYWIERFNYTEEDAILKVSEIQRNNGLKGYESVPKENRYFSLDYLTSRGYTEDEAREIFGEQQKSRSARSSKFSGKKHTNESKERISETSKIRVQEHGVANWVKHFGRIGGKSKGEVTSYNEIKIQFCENLLANQPIDKYYVDMLIGKKVIEFNGDYWHCNPDFYDHNYYHPVKKMFAYEIWEIERVRVDTIINLGYDVYIIWENNWNKNKYQELDNIKKFLNDT